MGNKQTIHATDAKEYRERRRQHALDEAIRVATSSSTVSHEATHITKAAKTFEAYLATGKVK